MADHEFPEFLPGLNLKKGLRLIGGSRETYGNVLLKFYRNRKNAIQDIKNCLTKNDIPAAQAVVHALKGVAGNIGAENLYAAVSELEGVLLENKKDEWSGRIKIADDCLAELLTSISAIAGKRSAGDNGPHPERENGADGKKIPQLMNELMTALEGYNTGSINILRSLKAAARLMQIMPELEVIEQLLDKYDFDGARDVLQGIIAQLDDVDENK